MGLWGGCLNFVIKMDIGPIGKAQLTSQISFKTFLSNRIRAKAFVRLNFTAYGTSKHLYFKSRIEFFILLNVSKDHFSKRCIIDLQDIGLESRETFTGLNYTYLFRLKNENQLLILLLIY